jgi:hypothetical protein
MPDHPQDWLLVLEALVEFAGNPRTLSSREERAYELIEEIAAEQGLAPSDCILQIDDDWQGPT